MNFHGEKRSNRTHESTTDQQLQRQLARFPGTIAPQQREGDGKRKKAKPAKNAPRFALGSELQRIAGVDLTRIDGIDVMVGGVGFCGSRNRNVVSIRSTLSRIAVAFSDSCRFRWVDKTKHRRWKAQGMGGNCVEAR